MIHQRHQASAVPSDGGLTPVAGAVPAPPGEARAASAPPGGALPAPAGEAQSLHGGGPAAWWAVALGVARTARPRQWVKNVLVFAAPGAAGVLGHGDILLRTLGAFAIFCLTASGTYLVNDSIDAAADRMHPAKRHRPVASGVVTTRLALALGSMATAAGIGLAWLLAGRDLAVVVAVYVGITFSYSLWLKQEPVIDLAAVASGFVLRAIAGGVAAGVVLSNWFLIVASFGSLFLVAGKRHVEHLDLGEARAEHRATLGNYSLGFLRYIRALSSGVAITAYCIWAFDKASTAGHGAIWFELSIVPFVIALLRYALLLDAGQGGAPEEIVLTNRPLQILGVLWIAAFAAGVYGH